MHLVKWAHAAPAKEKRKKSVETLTKAARLIETQRKLASPGSSVNQRAEFLLLKWREKESLLNTCFILPVSVMWGHVLCQLLDNILIPKDERRRLKTRKMKGESGSRQFAGFRLKLQVQQMVYGLNITGQENTGRKRDSKNIIKELATR